MSEDLMSRDYKIIGVWTKNLLHVDRPAPHAYAELKAQFLAHGGTLKSEQGVVDRTPREVKSTPADALARSFWTVGDDAVMVREDGLLLLTGLNEDVASMLHDTVESLSQRDERQTFSLAPLPPGEDPPELAGRPLSEILGPLNRGNLENARFWTTVDHQHEPHDTRKRYYQKIGIEIEEPEAEEKKKESA